MGQDCSTEKQAPNAPHFLHALRPSFPWDQRGIPSSEYAECGLHSQQVGELETHTHTHPTPHAQLPPPTPADQVLTQKFQSSPELLCPGLKTRMVPSGGHWDLRHHSSSLFTGPLCAYRASMGAPVAQRGVPLLPLGPFQSSFSQALALFLISPKERCQQRSMGAVCACVGQVTSDSRGSAPGL